VHIGLCSPHWPPSQANGIVSYVSAIRDHFIARGHEVSVVSQERLHTSDGATLSLAPSRTMKAVAQSRDRFRRLRRQSEGALPEVGRNVARQIAAAHRLRPFDVVEMEESFGWSDLAARAIAAPVITRIHGPHFLKPDNDLTERERREGQARCEAEARAVRNAAMVTAPTQAMMAGTCRSYSRDPAARSAVIANPIRLREDTPRWTLGGAEPGHVLMVGRFDYLKGADTMLLAFERLLETQPEARLTLVGPDEGMEAGAGRRIGFAEFAATRLSPRTRQRIEFRGLLSQAEIAPLRMKAMATVVSSRCENFPYVLLEAMAAGSPLVSTDWPGAEEIVIDGESGLLSPIAQPDRLAVTLDRILRDGQRAAGMGHAARERCASEFSLEIVGDKLLDCYRQTLEMTA
jgi:glycosyltransferase involved in cell wall biosynthesis